MEKSLFPRKNLIRKKNKEIKESTTDSESGYYVKDERTKQFAYSFHAAQTQTALSWQPL